MSTTYDILAQIISCYLNDDALVHTHLPHVMNVILTRSLLKDQKEESEEVTTVRRKWTIRLNALMQSKQATARWSAIVLIKLTCEQSPSLLFGHIRSWAGQLMGVVGVSCLSLLLCHCAFLTLSMHVMHVETCHSGIS